LWKCERRTTEAYGHCRKIEKGGGNFEDPDWN
jgi:hypothetical protein